MGSNQYKDIFITANEDYDYAVLLNCATASKILPKSNIIGFSHEPRSTLRGLNPYFINYVQDSVSEYYISNNSGLSSSFIEGFPFVCPHEYGQSKVIGYTEKRRKKISMILSLSNFMPGHNMRHLLLQRILGSDLDIHFYAKDLNKIYSDERVKSFDWDIFSKPYEEYEFQIVIENIIDNFWSSEKLTNCVIKETIPIYYGSQKSLDMFYHTGGVKTLSDDVDSNFKIISDVYLNGIYDQKIASIAKEELYSNYNLLEFIHKKFNV